MEPLKVAEPVEAREERRAEPRDDRRGQTRRDEPRRENRDEPRRDDRRDRRDYRDRDSGPSVVGMGDHVPDFILRSFAIAASPVEDSEDTPATGTEG